ncbi:MAG: 6-phosphogluconolactonase, partial [Mesorhizobium sp.]
MAREQLNSDAYNWHAFAERQDLAAALAGHVAGRLTAAIAERGTALLAVSGGTTPAKFFASLSSIPIAWNKVTVTLVDERCVPVSSPRSNAGLVAANLLQHAATAARFVPLYQ